MRTGLALAAALAVAACHRHAATDLTPDADDAARNTTAAKTLTDLAAADAAARAPLPVIAAPRSSEMAAPTSAPARADEPENDDAPDNEQD